MIKTDLHMHTVFCDGKNTPEEMVLSAIKKGLDTVGICAHSYIYFDDSYCIKKDMEKPFQEQVNALKVKYADKIRVLCGVEQDASSTASTDGFDYIIGSVHFVKSGKKLYEVDNNPEKFAEMVNCGFGGDCYLCAEEYYKTVASVVEKTGADIIGHFDLISKFNDGNKFFDDKNPRYIAAWKSAVDALIPYKKPFEINLGGISRGYKKEPYPSKEMIEYIKSKGGSFVFSSDAHNKENVAFKFSEYEYLVR